MSKQVVGEVIGLGIVRFVVLGGQGKLHILQDVKVNKVKHLVGVTSTQELIWTIKPEGAIIEQPAPITIPEDIVKDLAESYGLLMLNSKEYADYKQYKEATAKTAEIEEPVISPKEFDEYVAMGIHPRIINQYRLEGTGIPKHILDQFTALPPKDTAKERKEFLESIIPIVCKDRNSQYGSPEDNFKVIAEYWTIYLAHKQRKEGMPLIDAIDVSLMLTLLKMARMTTNQNSNDSWVDAAGYLACGFPMINKDERK